MIEEMTLFASNIILVAHYPIHPEGGVGPSEYAPAIHYMRSCNSDYIIILSEKFKLHLVIE